MTNHKMGHDALCSFAIPRYIITHDVSKILELNLIYTCNCCQITPKTAQNGVVYSPKYVLKPRKTKNFQMLSNGLFCFYVKF